MAHRYTCIICDDPMSPYGDDGVRCERCSQPCSTCKGVIGYCQHPLPPSGKPNGTFAQWYLDESPELAERLTEVECDTDPQSGWPRVAA